MYLLGRYMYLLRHSDSFYIHKSVHPFLRQLAAEAGMFGAAEGEARVGFYEGIDGAGAGLEFFGGDFFAAN